MFRAAFEDLAVEEENRQRQIEETGLESLRMLHKIFLLADISATLETRNFPKLAEQMGNKGAWDYFFTEREEMDSPEDIIADHEAFHASMFPPK